MMFDGIIVLDYAASFYCEISLLQKWVKMQHKNYLLFQKEYINMHFRSHEVLV